MDQQLCRWLLLSLDRLPNNGLSVTRELIADMLGIRRDGVIEAARKPQHAGLIECKRGPITVLGRSGLEARVCERYQHTDLCSYVTVHNDGNIAAPAQ